MVALPCYSFGADVVMVPGRDLNQGNNSRLADDAEILQEPKQRLIKWLSALEIVALFVVGITQTFFAGVVEKVVDPPNVLLSNFGILGLLVLSCFPAVRASFFVRALQFFLQMAILAIASAFGVPRLFDVLYLVYVARAVVVPENRFTFAPVAVAVLAHILSKELRYFLTERYIYALTPLRHLVHLLVVGRVVNFSLVVVLVAFCAHAVLSERRLRAERQHLNSEVEKVATQLERLRMAREIHDSAGHIMTAMCMHLDVALAVLEKNRDKAMVSLSLAKTLVDQFSKEVRLLSAPAVASKSLAAVLVEIQSKYEDDSSLFQLHVDAEDVSADLTESAIHDLTNMIKEGLHNIGKYAKASEVWLSVRKKSSMVEVMIRDNGCGFDLTKVEDTRFGLRGMRERTERQGGQFKIETGSGAGTLLVILLPMVSSRCDLG